MNKKEGLMKLLSQLEKDSGLCSQIGVSKEDVERCQKILADQELSDDDLKSVSGGVSNQELLKLQQEMSNYQNMLSMTSNIQKRLSEMTKQIIGNLR